jgi:hypothetical protein
MGRGVGTDLSVEFWLLAALEVVAIRATRRA